MLPDRGNPRVLLRDWINRATAAEASAAKAVHAEMNAARTAINEMGRRQRSATVDVGPNVSFVVDPDTGPVEGTRLREIILSVAAEDLKTAKKPSREGRLKALRRLLLSVAKRGFGSSR